MDGRNEDNRVARLERLAGLTAWHRESRWLILVQLLLYAMVMVGASLVLFAPASMDIEGTRWFYASLALWSTASTSSEVGHALCAGTLGRRHEAQGRALRAVAALVAVPAGAFMLAMVGYMLRGLAGAVVAGLLALLLPAVIALRQRRTSAAAGSDDRAS